MKYWTQTEALFPLIYSCTIMELNSFLCSAQRVSFRNNWSILLKSTRSLHETLSHTWGGVLYACSPCWWSNREMAGCVLANIEGGRTFQYTAAAFSYCFHLKNCTLSHSEFHIAFSPRCIPSKPIFGTRVFVTTKSFILSLVLVKSCYICFSISTKKGDHYHSVVTGQESDAVE